MKILNIVPFRKGAFVCVCLYASGVAEPRNLKAGVCVAALRSSNYKPMYVCVYVCKYIIFSVAPLSLGPLAVQPQSVQSRF